MITCMSFSVYPCLGSVPFVFSHLPKTENKQVIDKILSVKSTNQTPDNNIEETNQRRKTTVRRRLGYQMNDCLTWHSTDQRSDTHSPCEKETVANKNSSYQTTINQLKTGRHQNRGTDSRKKDNRKKEISMLLRWMFLLALAYQS